MNETINYRIEKLDKILAEKGKTNPNINRTLIMAYEDSIENKNPLINFNRAIWSADIAPIVDALRKNDIKEFSISNTASGLTKTLEAFEASWMQGLRINKSQFNLWPEDGACHKVTCAMIE